MYAASHDGLFLPDQVGAIGSQEKRESRAIGLGWIMMISTRKDRRGGKWA